MENYAFGKVLKFNKFYKAFVGFFSLTFGYTLSQIGLSWYINTKYPPQTAGMILFFSSIGSLFSVVFIGNILDKGKIEKIISYSAIISGMAIIIICGIIVFEPSLLVLLIIMLFIRGAIFPIYIIGFRLLCSKTFGDHPLLDTTAFMVSVLDSLQVIIAPILGGILENNLGVWAPLLIEAAASFVFFGFLVTYELPAVTDKDTAQMAEGLKGSIKYIFTSKMLMGIILLLFTLNFTTEPLTEIIMPQIMSNDLNTSSIFLGTFISCIAIGSITGAFVYNKIKIKRVGLVLSLSAVMIAFSIILLAFGDKYFGIIYISAFMQGFFTAPIDIGSILMRQKLVPIQYQGKIFSYSMVINKLGVPIGTGIAGLSIAEIGANDSIIFCGIILLFVAVLSLVNQGFSKAVISSL